jgi:hypothetical protein
VTWWARPLKAQVATLPDRSYGTVLKTTQLGEWARLGFFTRTGFGTYRLNTPSDQTRLTDPPDP